MIYRNFQDIKLSALGFGAMRLPVIDGDDSRIDEAAVYRMVDAAMAAGINYYDTAWGYHGMNSETVLGVPLPPQHSLRYNDPFRHVQPGTAGKERKNIRNGQETERYGDECSSWRR